MTNTGDNDASQRHSDVRHTGDKHTRNVHAVGVVQEDSPFGTDMTFKVGLAVSTGNEAVTVLGVGYVPGVS